MKRRIGAGLGLFACVCGAAVSATGCEVVLGLGGLHEATATDGGVDASGDGTTSASSTSLRDGGPSSDAPASGNPVHDASVEASLDGSGGGGDATADSNAMDAPSPPLESGVVGSGDGASDAAAPPPSCATGGLGQTNCSMPDGGTSCCASPVVSGGTFYRTYTSDVDGGATGLAASARVNPFRLDMFEVTVGRFRAFVDGMSAARWLPATGDGKHVHLNGGLGLVNGASNAAPLVYESGWDAAWNTNLPTTHAAWTAAMSCNSDFDTWTDAPGANENRPINCVNWYTAYAFCIWDGGFLPTEAEWEFAAAGGPQQREYPWGADDPGYAALYGNYACEYPLGNSYDCNNTGSAADIAPVGYAYKGIGAFGQLDLGGNIDELVLDMYNANFFQPCTDCVNLSLGTQPIVHGGNYAASSDYMTPSNRDTLTSRAEQTDRIGFRCARSP